MSGGSLEKLIDRVDFSNDLLRVIHNHVTSTDEQQRILISKMARLVKINEELLAIQKQREVKEEAERLARLKISMELNQMLADEEVSE